MDKETVELVSEINQGIEEFNDNLNQSDLLISGIGRSLKTIAEFAGAASISLGLKDMVSSLMKINDEATKSAVILGKNAFGKPLRDNIKSIEGNITSIQNNLDATTNKANELGNAFINTFGKPLEVGIHSNLDDSIAKVAALTKPLETELNIKNDSADVAEAKIAALTKPLEAELNIKSNLDDSIAKISNLTKPLEAELNIKSNLDDSIAKANILENTFTDILAKPLKAELDTTSLQKGIDISTIKTNTLENAFGKQLKNSVKEVEGSVISLQKEIEVSTEKAKELTNTLKDGAKKIEENIISLQTEIGVSTEKAKELTNAFLTKRITENIEQSTKSVAMFQRATGASTDSIMSMYNEMYHGASMSIENIDNILANMSKVQHTIGLSEEGMNAAIKSAGKLTTQLRGFGATDEQIKSSTVSLTKFVSSMEKVGVSAQAATSFVEKLMDPERIEENIGLYSQLGITMEEALNGNALNGSAMQEGLKEFSQRIVDMGPIAGNAYAKSFGYSYNQAMKTVKLDGPEAVEEVSQEDTMKSLKTMSEEVLGTTGKINKAFNQLKGTILNFGPAALATFAVIVAVLKKRISKALKEGFSEGIKDGISASSKNISKIGAGITGTIKAGAGMTGAMKENFNKVNSQKSGFNKSEEIEKIMNTLKTAGSGLDIKNRFIAEKIYNQQVRDAKKAAVEEELKQQIMLRSSKAEMYNAELDKLKDLQKIAKETGNIKLENRLNRLTSNAQKQETDIFEIVNKDKKLQTKAGWGFVADEQKNKISTLSEGKKSNETKILSMVSELRVATEVLSHQKKATSGEIAEAREKMNKILGQNFNKVDGKFNQMLVDAGGDIEKLSKLLVSKAGEGSELSNAFESLTKTTEDLKKAQERLETAENRREEAPGEKAKNGFLSGIKEGFLEKTGLKKAITFFKGDEETGKKGLKDRVKDLGGGSLKKGIGIGAANIGLGAIGGLTKAIGGLAVKVGIFGILGTLLKPLISTLQEKIAPIMENFTNFLSEVFSSIDTSAIEDVIMTVLSIFMDLAKSLLPTITKLIGSLAPLFMNLVESLLPPLLTVLGVLATVSGYLLQGIGNLIKLFPGKTADNIGNSIIEVSDSLKDTGKELRKASKTMGENSDVNKDILKQKKEEQAQESSKAATMSVQANAFGGTDIIESGAVRGNDVATIEASNASSAKIVTAINASNKATEDTSKQISEDQLALFDTVKQAVEAIYNYIQFSTLKVSMQS